MASVPPAAASSAVPAAPAAPTAPPAAPKAKWGDDPTPDVSDALAGLTQQMAESQPVEAEVDEPEMTGLDEKAGDEVIDGTSSNDALHSVTVDKFDSPTLALPPTLLKGLYEMNFVRPSRIQAISLPKIWGGGNLLAQSHNGTGKTACFVLGMLRTVSAEAKPQALCLCPTRELAKQISTEVAKMGKHHLAEAGIAIKTILREERYEKNDRMTEQIVIGTPGKVRRARRTHSRTLTLALALTQCRLRKKCLTRCAVRAARRRCGRSSGCACSTLPPSKSSCSTRPTRCSCSAGWAT